MTIDSTDPTEENLSWLQEFHATKIRPLAKNLPEDIPDDQLNKWLRSDSSTPSLPKILPTGFLRIYKMSDPGWQLEFFATSYDFNKYRINSSLDEWVDVNINYITNRVNIWHEYDVERLYALGKEDLYEAFGSALYLSLAIEAFKRYINKQLLIIDNLTMSREKLKSNNQILTWLENLYFQACIEDWESYMGSGLLSTYYGWIFIYSYMNDSGLESKPFSKIKIRELEGEIICYKQQDNSQFIIRTHSRGLIKGLHIFKKWVEC